MNSSSPSSILVKAEKANQQKQPSPLEMRRKALITKKLPPVGNKNRKYLQGSDFEFPEAADGAIPTAFEKPNRKYEGETNMLMEEMPRRTDYDFSVWRRCERHIRHMVILPSVVTALCVFLVVMLPKNMLYFGGCIALGTAGASWFFCYLWSIWSYRTITKFFGEQSIQYLLSFAKSEYPGYVVAEVIAILFDIIAHESPLRLFKNKNLERFMQLEENGRYVRPNSREWFLGMFRRIGVKLWTKNSQDKNDTDNFHAFTANIKIDDLITLMKENDPKLVSRWEERPRIIYPILFNFGIFGAMVALSAFAIAAAMWVTAGHTDGF